MSTKLVKIACALTLVLGLSFSAQAQVEHIRIGGDIEGRGIKEEDFDIYAQIMGILLPPPGEPLPQPVPIEVLPLPIPVHLPELAQLRRLTEPLPEEQDYLMTVSRLYAEVDLIEEVWGKLRILNVRHWDIGYLGDPTIELDLAYIQVDKLWGYPFGITFGRQELLYGEGFLIGDGVWSDPIRKAFDAIKLVWKVEPHQLDIFTAKIIEGYVEETDKDLYGINWRYEGEMVHWDLGGFLSDQELPESRNQTLALSARGECSWEGEMGTFAFKGEIVGQRGEVAPLVIATVPPTPLRGEEERRAWGGYVEGKYTFNIPFAPYLGLGYILMTGDDPATEEVEAFDPMFEDKRFGEIADWIYGEWRMTNARIWHLRGGVKPIEIVRLDINFYHFQADQEISPLIAPLFPFLFWPWEVLIEEAEQDKDIGWECNINLTYDYTENVSFRLMYGVFSPGGFFKWGLVEPRIQLEEASHQVLCSVTLTY